MKMGHNSGLAGIDALPASMQDLADVFGMGIVFALVEHFAGVELRIPHKLHDGHKLMVLGVDYAEALCQYCPEDTILVPMSLDRKRLTKKVNDLADRGFKRWEIARELGISHRHVRRLANAKPKESDQLSFFD